jgi:hypothetical protein
MKRFGKAGLFRILSGLRICGLFVCMVFAVLCMLPNAAFSDCPLTSTVADSFVGTEATQNGRLSRNGIASSCASTKAFPGTLSNSVLYKAYTYSNSANQDACVTVDWNSGSMGATAFISAYLNSYNPASIATNYLGDIGTSATGSFSVRTPANQNYVFVVNTVSGNQTGTYGFTIIESYLVKIAETSSYYSSIQTAYSAAISGQTVLMAALDFTEDLNLNGNNANMLIALQGGYNCDFASNPGFTVINGAITISGGTVTVENVTIQ